MDFEVVFNKYIWINHALTYSYVPPKHGGAADQTTEEFRGIRTFLGALFPQ